MTLQEQIREILFAVSNLEKPVDKAEVEILKLVSSACQQQRVICAKAELDTWSNNENLGREPLKEILNAPLPSGVERTYSEKDVNDIVEKVFTFGNRSYDEMGMWEEMSGILSKEYGIKI